MRLILDTNVVRGIGAGDCEPEGFVRFRKAGGSIHLADGTIVELVQQVSSGHFPWPHWVRARLALDRLLDHKTPVMIGGRELLATVGIHVGGPPRLPTDEQLKLTRGAWKLLVGASSPSEIGSRSRVIRVAGRRQRLSILASKSTDIVRQEKADWVRLFRKLLQEAHELIAAGVPAIPARSEEMAHFRAVVAAIGRNIDSMAGPCEPPPSVRLDALIRVYILLQVRCLRRKEPYNPEKHANDVFDHDLLRYLALPAAICTADAGIRRDLTAAEAWQSRWVIHPEQLDDTTMSSGRLRLDWPAPRVQEAET